MGPRSRRELLLRRALAWSVGCLLAGVLLTTILMLLAEGFRRQPFIDVAVVLAAMSLVGTLTFARVMERNL